MFALTGTLVFIKRILKQHISQRTKRDGFFSRSALFVARWAKKGGPHGQESEKSGKEEDQEGGKEIRLLLLLSESRASGIRPSEFSGAGSSETAEFRPRRFYMKEQKAEEKKKGFFAKLFEKLDRKLEDKAKKSGCCCGPKNDNGDSCCS